MSTPHPQSPGVEPGVPDAVHTAQNQAAPAGDGPSGADAGRGGTGAPPSNTAPDNCNFKYQPLRWGIDSLYLSYPGELHLDREQELRALKLLAQGPDFEASKAQLQLGPHVFEVKDKSSGLFPFTLVDDAYMIRLSAKRAKSLPMAYVQVSSRLLSHLGAAAIEAELRAILAQLGEVHPPKVSRVDLFLDFACDCDMESWGREAWITKAAAVNQYAKQSTFTGWTIGEGGGIMARLYHKLLECETSGKSYLLDLWRQAGWDGKLPVWRLEFEFKREVLTQLGLDGLLSVLDARAGLWDYATTQWLKLTQPSETDQARSRWPLHPLWLLLASVDWIGEGGPLLRTYEPSRAPSPAWLGARALSLVASMAAVVGITDLDAAAAELVHLAHNSLADRYSLSGVSLDAGFVELVEANNRKYNLRLNPPPQPKRPQSAMPLNVPASPHKLAEGESINPYERASKGQ
uniref:Replication initiation factor n=1 Tax=mine drainage metagenome TaxID=410659 RepID=E6PTM2_9ZZZZ